MPSNLITSNYPIEIEMPALFPQRELREFGPDVTLQIFQMAKVNYSRINKQWNAEYKRQQRWIANHLADRHVTRVLFPQIASSGGNLEELDKNIKQLYLTLNQSAKYDRLELDFLHKDIDKGVHIPRFEHYLSDLASLILALPNQNGEGGRRQFARRLFCDITCGAGFTIMSIVLGAEGTDWEFSLIPLAGSALHTFYAASDYRRWRALLSLSEIISQKIGQPFGTIQSQLSVSSEEAPPAQIVEIEQENP